MTTRADITREASKLINRHASGSATTSPGNATTLVDTVGLANYPDDQFNGGTIWLTSGANAGLTRPITDFVTSTDTLTFSAFPFNIASGVTYEATDSSLVTYQDLKQAAALALREIGKILSEPDETLETVDGQLVYTLPTGVSDVAKVEIVTDLGEDTEEHYLSTHWEERQGELWFDYAKQPATDRHIRIYYRKFHDPLTADDDEIDAQIDDEYLVYLTARQAMRMAYKRTGNAGSETITDWLNEAIEEAKKHRRQNKGMPMFKVRTA
jgi:hypothetical protein